MSWRFDLEKMMTLTVTLELSPIEEQQLRKSIANHDSEVIRRLLLNALEPTVAHLLQRSTVIIEDEERWEALTQQLHKIVEEALPPNFQGLSDYAVSREGIYADHP